jgi:hypothetical protein
MGRRSHAQNLSHEPVMDVPDNGLLEGLPAITARHKLLTQSWAGDVEAMEKAIGRFTVDRRLTNECHVMFFEMHQDAHLHVNITHKHLTKAATGWAGPGNVPDGFVHNRTFGDTQQSQIVRHIRDMVFAERI